MSASDQPHVATYIRHCVRKYGRVSLEPDEDCVVMCDFDSATSYPREDLNWAIWVKGGVPIF